MIEAPVGAVEPHPTVMRILNDARIGRYHQAVIDTGLRRDGIEMACFPVAAPATVI